jgi:DNA-binding SARP family transcriptional activator
VSLPAWRSRQARTLLKMLVARRGRPVRRTELCETLWPDDEPQRTAHRLSVILSAVRTVLDPARLRPADHYVRADIAGVSLDICRVVLAVVDLLCDAAHGVTLAATGELDLARAVLAGVDAAYRGDAFDHEPYEDWADALREEARAGWIRALRELARLHRRAGDLDQATTVLVRLLAADPFDESAHRALVDVLMRARRYGEARRAFGRWVEAMRAIDAPAPGPEVLRGLVAGRGSPAYAVAGRAQQA